MRPPQDAPEADFLLILIQKHIPRSPRLFQPVFTRFSMALKHFFAACVSFNQELFWVLNKGWAHVYDFYSWGGDMQPWMYEALELIKDQPEKVAALFWRHRLGNLKDSDLETQLIAVKAGVNVAAMDYLTAYEADLNKLSWIALYSVFATFKHKN